MAYANNKQIIAGGRITLYQRDDVKDAIWQCRIPFKGVRGYIKRTTGEKDFHKAAVVAIKLLGEIEHRIVTDQPLSPSTFKSVAGEFIKAAKTRMDEGRSSAGRYNLIKGTLQRYFLLYFGKRDITMIKKKDLVEYRAWRQALDQTQPCIIRNRDRSQTMMISDSGGYQIAGGHMVIQNTADILRILRWQEQYADWSMTLDVPTVNVGKPGFKYSTFSACLDQTVDYLNFYATNR